MYVARLMYKSELIENKEERETRCVIAMFHSRE